MAYRRRQGFTRSTTFKEEIYRPPPPDDGDSSISHLNNSTSSSSSSSSPSSSLAAQAIRASTAHRDSSSLSSNSSVLNHTSKGAPTYDYTSMTSSNEAGGFWGVLARKAKSLMDEENISQQAEISARSTGPAMLNSSKTGPYYPQYQPPENSRKMDNPKLRKGLDALASSLNHIGGTIGNALEEGRAIVENKTADIIQETRKLQIRRKGANIGDQNPWQQHPTQANIETTGEDQLKASRDVAMATAAKAKLLLRELKTVKADLAFAKLRCSQLEEENKILREGRGKRENPADDDLIRLQLETLLAEKARLAHDNSVYARENRFLREIVEYHQLTMQDLVYLDEGIEEVTEVYPIPAVSRMLSVSPPSPASPCSSREISPSRRSPSTTKEEPQKLPVQQKATADDHRQSEAKNRSLEDPTTK